MVTVTISAPPLTWGITLERVSSAGSACDLASRETGVTLEWAITKTPAARRGRLGETHEREDRETVTGATLRAEVPDLAGALGIR